MAQGGPPKNTLFNMSNMAGLQPLPRKKFDNSVCLIVNNLSETTFDNDLYKHFSSKGFKLAGVRVITDRTTCKSRGFGYLNFHSEEETERCYNEMRSSLLNTKTVTLSKKRDSDFDN